MSIYRDNKAMCNELAEMPYSTRTKNTTIRPKVTKKPGAEIIGICIVVEK